MTDADRDVDDRIAEVERRLDDVEQAARAERERLDGLLRKLGLTPPTADAG